MMTKLPPTVRKKTSFGWVPEIKVMSNADEIAKLGKEKEKAPVVDGANVEKEPKMPINEYHEQLGHPSFALTCATAKAQNFKLERPPHPHSACGVSKAKQKRISKYDMKLRSKKLAKFFLLDISSQKKISLSGKQHWLLIVDDVTDNSFSYFLKT